MSDTKKTKSNEHDSDTVLYNPYLPTKTKVISFKRESKDCFLLRLDLQSDYLPGQFFQILIPGIGEAPISVASCSEKFLDLNIREVGNVTKTLAQLKVGDFVFVRGPYGKGYPMDGLGGKNLILIGGGSGVAPLKGVMAYLEKHLMEFNKIKLFFGFRSPADVLFKSDIKKWTKNYDVNLTVDSNPNNQKIECEVCFITKLIENSNLDPENTAVFICGPPIMMKISADILSKKGFSDEQIYVSTERLMHCALGVCGHCMIHGKYTCLDGPVFRYDEIKNS